MKDNNMKDEKSIIKNNEYWLWAKYESRLDIDFV